MNQVKVIFAAILLVITASCGSAKDSSEKKTEIKKEEPQKTPQQLETM